jgi:putative ABC transport system permease protein
MTGYMPTMPGEVIAGADVAAALGLLPGGTVRADLGTGPVEMTVTATVERGGPEDGALLVDLGEAQRLSGNLGRVSAVFVRAASGEVDRAVEALRAALPRARVKSLRQVAEAEEAFLRKIELLMALVTVVVLVTSSISVSSTMSATVLERLKEIGLMKAMGGTRREIGAFYLAEGLGIGVMGGLAGFVLGVIAAEAVARGAFGTFVPVPLWLVPLGVVVGGAVAVSASYLPLTRALGTAPSIVLRGE